MIATCRVFQFRLRTITRRMHKMASNIYVRCVDGDDKVKISFDYSHKGGEVKFFNALRPQDESIGRTLERLTANVSKKVEKKRKRQADPGEEEPAVRLKALFHNETEIPDGTSAKDALVEGNMVTINETKLLVQVNAPCCLGLVLPETVMACFPIYPKIDIEFTDLQECDFSWEKIKYEEKEQKDANNKKQKTASRPQKVLECIKVSDKFSYTPTNDDIDFYLRLTCIPKSGGRTGRPYSNEAKFSVTAGPGPCPFEQRQLYTKTVTGKGEFRVVSYNILADLYADSEFTRTELFPYCPPYALSIDYRKHLIIKELTGYNSDIMCLQEVDRKVYLGELQYVFEQQGFDGSFKAKGGQVVEGSAIFYRKSKFRLIEQYDVILKDVLETEPFCADILEKAYSIPALKQIVETRTTALHILALEPVDRPGRTLLVANTHLYFHPTACHVRIIQNLIAMRYIENILNKYGRKSCSLVFCGDFNSAPDRGIYEYMTKKHISEDHVAWKEAPADQVIGGMNFSHDLNLDSACGIVPYTNYTAGFHGMLDYIYFDIDTLKVIQGIPQPDHKDVEFHVALPSIVFPSDHIAQICDFKWNF